MYFINIFYKDTICIDPMLTVLLGKSQCYLFNFDRTSNIVNKFHQQKKTNK